MAPGQRAIDALIDAYKEEYSEENELQKEYKEHCQMIVKDMNEFYSTSPYRENYNNTEIIVATEKRIGSGILLSAGKKKHSCNPPGWFSRWWNNIYLDARWQCSHCNELFVFSYINLEYCWLIKK